MINEHIRQRLVDAQENFDSIFIPEADFPPIPDGKYEAAVMDLEIKESRAGALMLAWRIDIISPGPSFGRRVYMNNMLEGEYCWIAKKNVLATGVQLEHLVDLPDKIAEIIERQIEVTLKTTEKDGKINQNCFINKELENAGVPDPDDDLTF